MLPIGAVDRGVVLTRQSHERLVSDWRVLAVNVAEGQRPVSRQGHKTADHQQPEKQRPDQHDGSIFFRQAGAHTRRMTSSATTS